MSSNSLTLITIIMLISFPPTYSSYCCYDAHIFENLVILLAEYYVTMIYISKVEFRKFRFNTVD